MLSSIAGRSVIVTGASKGIGKGMARVFASKGAKVLVVARHLGDAAKVVADIKKAGGTATAFAGDVAKVDDMEKMAAAAASIHGGIDILCANAGIYPLSRLQDMTPGDFDSMIATNLKGTFLAIKACLPEMKRRGKGRIIMTSSITGPITGIPGCTHYGASKAGQLGFMRTAAIELAPHNITVNAVLPGNVMTEGLEGHGADYLKKMTASVPLGRLGSIEDIAYGALFLASDEAAYITGQTLVIDGGQILPESLMALEEMGSS